MTQGFEQFREMMTRKIRGLDILDATIAGHIVSYP